MKQYEEEQLDPLPRFGVVDGSTPPAASPAGARGL